MQRALYEVVLNGIGVVAGPGMGELREILDLCVLTFSHAVPGDRTGA